MRKLAKGKPESETELAKLIVKYLEDLKWDVYQEIQFFRSGQIADIAAVQNGYIWIIECKLSAGIKVMEQAAGWLHNAHYVSVAIPNGSGSSYFKNLLRQQGIGCISVADYGDSYYRVSEEFTPKLQRINMSEYMMPCFRPEYKTHAQAGSKEGGRYSLFVGMCEDIKKYLKDHPGATLKETITVGSVMARYGNVTNAYSSIRHWLLEGVIKGVEIRYSPQGKIHVYLKDQPDIEYGSSKKDQLELVNGNS